MADNFTFKNASGATVTARAADNSSVYLPGTFVATSAGVEATDDGAAAGPIYPAAGLYQTLASVDEIDTGDVGRVRVSARRGQIVVPDYRQVWATSASVASAGDIEVSTTAWNSGYAAPAITFFDGADAGFGAAARWIRIPMLNWNKVSVRILGSLTVAISLTVSLYTWVTATAMTADSGSGSHFLDTATIATTVQVYFSPYAVGAAGSASIRTVAALQNPMYYLVVELTPSGDPAGGSIQFVCARS